jgi:hypothetical protein
MINHAPQPICKGIYALLIYCALLTCLSMVFSSLRVLSMFASFYFDFLYNKIVIKKYD